MIIRYKNHNLANTQIGSLSPRLFQQYLNTLAKQYSRASIIKIWSIIKQCVKFGEIQNELPINTTAMVKVPIESKVAHKKKIKVAESAAIVKGNDGKKISIDKVPKSKSSIRYIPLPNRAMEMIKYFKEHNASTGPDDYVCLSGNNTKLMILTSK